MPRVVFDSRGIVAFPVTPRRHAGDMQVDRDMHAVEFAQAAQRVGEAARANGLVVPSFRSPPRSLAVQRTVRWTADGCPVVAIRLRGRTHAAVHADMAEAVVVVNGLQTREARRIRAEIVSWLSSTSVRAA